MIGKRIKDVRSDANLSQTELANKISVSKQTLYKYENNIITNIPSDKIELIATACGVSPAYLMGWDVSAPATSHLAVSDLEEQLIRRFRELPQGEKNMILRSLGIKEKGESVAIAEQNAV